MADPNNIYDLALHERTNEDGRSIMKVPGGWIYSLWENQEPSIDTFVPYNDEFAPKSERDEHIKAFLKTLDGKVYEVTDHSGNEVLVDLCEARCYLRELLGIPLQLSPSKSSNATSDQSEGGSHEPSGDD